MGHVVFHRDDQVIPILRAVVFQALVRSGQGVVATLELRLSDEHAAVGIRSRAELQLQHEVLGKLVRRPQLLTTAPFRRRGHDQPAMFGHIASVIAARLAIERGLLFKSLLDAQAPTGQILAIKQADRARFGCELVVFGFHEPEGRQNGPQRCGPFGVAGLVGMQQIGEFSGFGIPLLVSEQRPSLDQRELPVPLHRGGIEGVELLDLGGWPFFGLGTGEDLTDNHRQLGIVLLEGSQNQFEVSRDRLGFGILFQIIGAH